MSGRVRLVVDICVVPTQSYILAPTQVLQLKHLQIMKILLIAAYLRESLNTTT